MKTKHQQNLDLLNEALSESGIVCFHNIDQPLVSRLCDIIGFLYRGLEVKGMIEKEIEELINS